MWTTFGLCVDYVWFIRGRCLVYTWAMLNNNYYNSCITIMWLFVPKLLGSMGYSVQLKNFCLLHLKYYSRIERLTDFLFLCFYS